MFCVHTLAKFLTEELQVPAVPPAKLSTKQKKTSPPTPQKKQNADFSDEGDVNDASAEELEPETFERLDYNHGQQGTIAYTYSSVKGFKCFKH